MENQDINPWLHIWTRPRETMRSILSTDPNRWVLWLAIIGGILSGAAFLLTIRTELPLQRQVAVLPLIVWIVLGAIFSVIHLYFAGWLYRLTGSWVKGKGTFTEVKSAVGWSYYPFFFSSILNIISSLLKNQHILSALLGLIAFIIIIWGMVIFFKILSEAHQFSVWKGILTFLIACVIIFVAIMIVALFIPLLKPIFQ